MGTDGVRKATHKPANYLAIKKKIEEMRKELKFKPKSSAEIMGDLYTGSQPDDSTAQNVVEKASENLPQVAGKNTSKPHQ